MSLILSLIFLLGAYGFDLLKYILSADDLINISFAPQNLHDVVRIFTTLSTQYRPLTHSLYGVYRALMPHFSTIFFLNLIIVSCVWALLIKNISRFVDKKLSYAIAFATALSPIFYYHVFSVSSLNNSLMLIVNLSLLTMIDFSNKKQTHASPLNKTKICIGAILFVVSILIKETFLLNTILFSIIAWQSLNKKAWPWIISAVFVTMFYLLVRILFFPSADPNYAFTFSFSTLTANILNIGSWLLSFPRGWQYGAPEAKTIITFAFSLVMSATFALSAFMTFRTARKVAMAWLIALCSSIIPFLFANRILVYYLDGTFILLIILVTYSTQHMADIYKRIIIIGFCVVSLLHFFIVYPQWQQYSFVSRANMTATNYLNEIKKVDLSHYQNLCILNHSEGKWATMDGNLARYVTGSSVHIISSFQTDVPLECKKDSVVLFNNGVEYKLMQK